MLPLVGIWGNMVLEVLGERRVLLIGVSEADAGGLAVNIYVPSFPGPMGRPPLPLW